MTQRSAGQGRRRAWSSFRPHCPNCRNRAHRRRCRPGRVSLTSQTRGAFSVNKSTGRACNAVTGNAPANNVQTFRREGRQPIAHGNHQPRQRGPGSGTAGLLLGVSITDIERIGIAPPDAAVEMVVASPHMLVPSCLHELQLPPTSGPMRIASTRPNAPAYVRMFCAAVQPEDERMRNNRVASGSQAFTESIDVGLGLVLEDGHSRFRPPSSPELIYWVRTPTPPYKPSSLK